MLAIFNVTAPFFALVLCGYLAARARMLPDAAVPALNGFVLYFALPCMLFRFAAGAPLSQIANGPVFLTYLATGLIAYGVVVFALRYGRGESMRDASLGGLCVAWSNWGYMGFALLPPILGHQSAAIIIAAGMVDLLVIMSLALALSAVGDAAHGGPRAALVAALRGVAKNPLIWAVLVGLVVSGSGVKLPQALDTFIALLGTGAGPIALFTIGMSLYRPPQEDAAQRSTLKRGDVLFLTAAKLVIHPYLLLVAAKLMKLPAQEMHVLVLMAALPAAGSVFLFATRLEADAERVSAVILLTTALTFVTFSLMLYVVGAVAPPL